VARTGAIRAGRAFVELFADDSALVRGLRAARYKLQRFGQQISAMGKRMMFVGVGIGAALGATAKAFSVMGDRLGKLSKRTGLSVEALSELQFAAERSGSSMDGVEKGVRRMQRTIYDLERGLSTSQDAFGDLGLAMEDLAGLTPEQQFMLIAGRLRDVEDASRRAGIAQQIFGRSGTELLPMLSNLEALREEARALGLTISTEDAEAAELFTDRMGDLWRIIKRTAFSIGAGLAPLLEDVTEWFRQSGKAIVDWIDRNRGLVKSLALVAAGLIATGAAIVALGVTISLLGTAFGVVATALSVILSPIGLVVAAVAGLGAAILKYTDIGKRALNALAERFEPLVDAAKEAFGAIKNALMAGDIKAAANVLWTGLKLLWSKGVGWLKGIWHDFVYDLQDAWAILTNALASAWARFVRLLTELWAKAKGLVKTGWEKLQHGLASMMGKAIAALDPNIKAEDLQRRLDEVHKQNLQNIADEKNAAINAAEDRYKKEAGDQQKEYRDKLAAIEGARKKQIEADKEAAEKARKEYEKALEKARIAGKGTGMPENVEEAAEKAGREGSRMMAASTAGTFSAWAAWGMAAGNVQDRIAAATEETAANTEEIARKKAVFAAG